MRQHHLEVTRTARYATLGEVDRATSVWFVIHGHGQLASLFLRHFEQIDDGTRYIVAPEALNRFYAEPTSWKGAGQARVGATWMTREDREAEMRDYVRYLDQLLAHVRSSMGGRDAPLTVLGFSQGVATAARWVCRGRARAQKVILWAGPLPPELDAESARPLREADLYRVIGEQDDMAAPEAVAAEQERERLLGLSPRHVRFVGGHKLDAAVLSSLA